MSRSDPSPAEARPAAEATSPAAATDAVANPKPSNMTVEYGPLLVFVVLYNVLRRDDPDGAIYTAATVFAVVAGLALVWSKVKTGRVPGILAFSTLMIGVTVGLAWVFRDPRFIYMKPTVVNGAYAVIAIGGALVGKNPLRMLMGSSLALPERVWNTLAVRWGLFFLFCAGLNEFIWRTQSEAFWANFKLLGFVPLTLLFALSQVPLMMKHGAGALGERA